MAKSDPSARRQEIYNVALRLFKREGFDAVRVDDILSETGLSKGGFYHHFKSREDILREIVAAETSKFKTSLDESLGKSDPLAALQQLFLQGSASLGADTGILGSLKQFSARTVYLDELERQLALHLKPHILNVIEQGVASSVFRKVDSVATAEIFMAVNNHGNRCAVLGEMDSEKLRAYNYTAIEALGRHLGVENKLQELLTQI